MIVQSEDRQAERTKKMIEELEMTKHMIYSEAERTREIMARQVEKDTMILREMKEGNKAQEEKIEELN